MEALPLSLCRTPKESTIVEIINISPSLANAMLCVRLGFTRVSNSNKIKTSKFKNDPENYRKMSEPHETGISILINHKLSIYFSGSFPQSKDSKIW